MKKILALIMSLVLLLSAFALAETELAEDWNFPDGSEDELLDDDDGVTGMWEYTDMDSCKGDDALRELFAKATAELTGVLYTPAALLATQTATGNNYCILCHCSYTDSDTADSGWALVYVNEAFGGEVKVTNVVNIDIAALADYGIFH